MTICPLRAYPQNAVAFIGSEYWVPRSSRLLFCRYFLFLSTSKIRQCVNEISIWFIIYSTPTINQVKKIVEGSFQSFQLMYRPLLQEYIAEGLLKASSHGQYKTFRQVYYCLLILIVCSKR